MSNTISMRRESGFIATKLDGKWSFTRILKTSLLSIKFQANGFFSDSKNPSSLPPSNQMFFSLSLEVKLFKSYSKKSMIRKTLSNLIICKKFLQFYQKTGISLNKFSKRKSRKAHWSIKDKFCNQISYGLSSRLNNWWFLTWKTSKWTALEHYTHKKSKRNKPSIPTTLKRST